MNVTLPEKFVSTKRNILIKELIQVKEYATKLKFLLMNKDPVGNRSHLVKEMMTNVLRSFSETISMMTSSEACSNDDEFGLNASVEDCSLVAVSCSDNMKSEDSSDSTKRLLHSTTKDRRGSYKRRKTDETRTVVSQTTGDIHSWRKYGQKEILNSEFPRSYFRCTRKHDQGCKATKQVQQIEEKPEMYQITYIGFHTCNASLQTPQMVTFSADTNWDTLIVNPHSQSKNVLVTYDQKDSSIVKQEYSNIDDCITQKSVLTDNLLDPNLWFDFKDFELSKPVIDNVYSCTESQNLKIDFGLFCSDFSNDLVYFDENHHLL